MMRWIAVTITLFVSVASLSAAENEAFQLTLRSQVPADDESGLYHYQFDEQNWNPKQTAIIVCDMWDLHHCYNAVQRETEMAPRMNRLLKQARDMGATIIHSPSGCMAFYEDHPARKRAQSVEKVANLPEEIGKWCYQIPAEERGVYPIDQSDGGEDDDPVQHAKWAKSLEAKGLNPRAPWTRQTDMLDINEHHDYISDNGEEIWSILERNGLQNVMLLGVHTNMCVLGRPFGLRQMSKNGKNVVLVRDMTDTMYNPGAWPYVSHFTGTDLIVEHIEKFVCPTVSSAMIIGGTEFRYKNDKRPHLAIVIAEDEYRTNETLPPFAKHTLGKNFKVTILHGSKTERNDIPNLHLIDDADVLFLSIRRRTLPPEQLAHFKKFEASGKPMIGIRTASHPFHLRKKPAPEGLADWPTFDADVWGGNYSNHYGNGPVTQVSVAEGAKDHPMLKEVDVDSMTSKGSLYVVRPLADKTIPILMGTIPGEESEPRAWTFTRKNGGKSFYTSLGHIGNFDQPAFIQFLANAVHWAAGLPTPAPVNDPASATKE
ncbi:MAG: isochorismatase family protein [Planctomycetaceae bacterium]|nr:isochorismatase family protein [Planctomycetaceae bacterium]